MAALLSNRKTVWFSSSVPRAKVNEWDGDVVDNPFEAQYLFADNEDASDVEKIFTSKEFLTGKLTIFHWSLLDHFGSPKHFSCKDLKNLVIFPWKELEDLGMAANQPEQTNEFSDCDMDDGDFSEANENQQKEHGKDVEVLVKMTACQVNAMLKE